MEAGGRVPVHRAQQEPSRVGRVGGGGEVAVGGPVAGDDLGLHQGGVALGVGRDRAERGAVRERRGVPPGGVGDDAAHQGHSRAEHGRGQGGGEVVVIEPVGQQPEGESAQRE